MEKILLEFSIFFFFLFFPRFWDQNSKKFEIARVEELSHRKGKPPPLSLVPEGGILEAIE